MLKLSKSSTTKALYAAMAAFVVFVWAASLAATRTITGVELRVFRDINNLSQAYRGMLFCLTQLGSVWVLFVLVLLLLWRRRKLLAVRVLGLGAMSFAATEVLKRAIVRPRPDLILPYVHIRELSIGMYGFPSGHTAMATVMSVALLRELTPKYWKPLAGLWVLTVAFSRIYLGAHAPLDVVGGACIGVAILSIETLFRNREKRFNKYL